MSFLDEYNKALEEEKKKKKKSSFMDEYRSSLSQMQEDIAPVATTVTTKSSGTEKEDSKLDFFKAGAFEDGYQFGDVTKTILGTYGDWHTNVANGAIDTIEGVLDWGAYALSDFAGWVGNDKAKENLKTIAQADLQDTFTPEAIKELQDKQSQYSVLGRTTQSGAQVLGQGALMMATGGVLGAAGVGTAGTTVATTLLTGTSSMGSGRTEAYQGGATDEEARKYGLAAGTIDAASELLFGAMGKAFNAVGFSKGLLDLDDVAAKAVGKLAKSDAGKNVLEYLTKSSFEGLEEVIAGYLQAHAKKGTYQSEEEFADILKDENLWEQFLLGTFAGAAFQGGDLIDANTSGRDFISGLNANEQAVVDKEFENRLAEKEKDGKKVSTKEKNKIYDDVLADMEKGYISTDTIEEVLGGEDYNAFKAEKDNFFGSDTYKAWQETTKSEESKIKELEAELKELESEADSQYAQSLRSKLENLKNNSQAAGMKSQLDSEAKRINAIRNELRNKVFDQVKDGKLAESYHELTRSQYKFEVDTSKYKGRAKEVMQQVMDSGLVDNTNKSHEFWESMAKIATDQDTSITAVNSEQILELAKKEYAAKGKTFDESKFQGKTIDGIRTKDGIAINVESKRALNFTAGHEITHSFEKSGHYDQLQKVLFAYAKDEYQRRYNERAAQYKGIYSEEDYKAEIDKEVTADMVGDFLFTDYDFVSHLSTANRNVFQKIWDELKYLAKVFKAGSKEARELEKAKKVFEEVYRESAKQKNTADSDVKYSVAETTDGRFVAVVDSDILSGIDTSKWDDDTKKAAKKAANEALKTFSGGFNINGIEYVGNKKSRDEYTRSDYSEALANNNPEAYLDKMRAASVIDDVVRVATDWANDGYLKYDNQDYVDFVRGKTLIRSGDKSYRAVVLAGIKENGKAVFHDVVDIYPDSFEIKESESYTAVATNKSPNAILKDSDGGIVAQNGVDVKSKLSLSDSDGKKLSKEQQEFFKDSKIRDDNGNLKVMHHGSGDAFTVFDRKKAKSSGYYGNGFYFTDSESHAKQYGNTYDVYLNITNPLHDGTNDITKKQLRKFVEAIAENEDYGIENYGYGATVDSVTNSVYGKSDFAMLMDINASCVGNMVEAIELFNEVNGTDYNGIVASTETVAFYPEQIKSVDNKAPTSDPDIRFSLSEAVEETKDLLAVHNLTSEQVLKSLELGGLPMPSIAVLKADSVHNEYGDVSLILPKEAIDPKANSANKVYGGDAWTPVYPRIEYKPNAKVEKKISDKYYGLARKIGYDAVRPMYEYVTDLERQLNNASGEAAMLEKLYDDTDMMNLYLQDSGKGKIEPIEKETVTEISPEQAEMNQFFIDALGDEVIASYPTPSGESMGLHRRQFVEQHGDEIKSAYKRFFMERYDFTETEADNAIDNTSKADLLHIVRDAYQYTQNKGVTVKTEVDRQATEKAIRDAAADGYKDWVDGLFKGVEEKTGIRNNQDYYTRSGNPRSWDALHWENTLENVVRVMKGQEETGTTSFSPYNSLASLAQKRYGSIAEIKADSNRLGKVSEEEYAALGDSFANRFSEIANSIKDPAVRNPFIATDEAAELIVDAVRTQKTKASMLSYLQKWNKRVTKQTVDDVVSLVNDIANMPTGYFEAKPKRAVTFEEVGVFVIPNNADVKLKQELLNRGYSIAEYDPNVEGDRQRVVNQFEELKFSLSDATTPKKYGNWNVYAKNYVDDLAPFVNTATTEDSAVAPVREIATVEEMFPDNITPIEKELEQLEAERDQVYSGLESAIEFGTANEVGQLAAEYDSLTARIRELENKISENDSGRVDSLMGEEAPPEMDAPYSGEEVSFDDPFADRDISSVGSQKVQAYSDEHPELKPFIQEEARNLYMELSDTTRGERWFNDDVYYATGGEKGFYGVKRDTSQSIETLLDQWGMSYDSIESGLMELIEDAPKKHAAAKKLEFMRNDRMLYGYKDFYTRKQVPPNQGYIDALKEMQYNESARGSFDALMQEADIAPVPTETVYTDSFDGVVKGQESYITTDDKLRNRHPQQGAETILPLRETKQNPKVAKVLTEEPAIAKEKSGIGSKLVSSLVDKGMVFETLSLKKGNHELQSKWNYALPTNTEARAQYYMTNGDGGVTPLKDIVDVVNKSGKKESFFDYLYHWRNVDSMTLEDRFDIPNMTVFGETVTADVSRKKIAQYEKANPEFKALAEKFYAIGKDLRKKMVEGNIISQQTADWWEKKYPHYVPIGRVDTNGQNISVPLDTNKTGVNNPVKKAKGGSSDMRPLDVVMAERIEQTFRAIARNSFGIELKNTLGTTIAPQPKPKQTGSKEIHGQLQFVDDAIETIEAQDDKLLKPGTKNSAPTFTVFENGERVEFEITEDMFDALKPVGKILGYRNKSVKAVGDARRNLLTVWNPVFALYRNPIKDIQDVAVNSQHALKTYKNIPTAIYQMATGGKFAEEYHRNGGKSNTYFDGRNKKFKAEDNVFKKVIGMPVRAIETAGEFIEEIPRLAEYIASRQEGRSVERSMLDAARVTTNFAAGGDFTKFLNSHGFTFLNASVQGASQHVRNFRESAHKEGIIGVTKTLAKYAVAGLPALLLNGLLWDDDEEYEELSDYVKQNYYVIAKTKDGKFVRIPKGRTAAVMSELMQQMTNLVTGNDEADFATFFELFWNNIAPNNPVENNILAPVVQTLTNKAWYGGDIVPSRLQDVPADEQYDESTDILSKWIGEHTGTSPYKWNYLIDQYSGGLGDVFLPMMTPEAESGDDTLLGNLLAPWKKEITTDKVLNNKNPGDFYDLRDELEKKANSSKATEEDTMRSMYMDSVSWDMSDLYKQKREIQNSDLSDSEKYEQVRAIQEQINELAKNALSNYNDVSVDGLYAEAGDRRYNKDAETGKWYEIHETNADGTANYFYKQEQKVTKALGISYAQYWNNREEYDYAYDKPEQYALSQAVGGYQSFRGYTSDLWDIKADKDENGKSINGSRKEKVIDYLNNLDIDYYHKIILFKNEYNADDTYNYEIIEYLNSREDISYAQMETILKHLGFDVDSNGNISW